MQSTVQPHAGRRLALCLGFLLLTGLPALAQDQASPQDRGAMGDDQRANFEAHFFLGSAFDNFAADDVDRYLNPDASGAVSDFERLIGGIDFAYRLLGSKGTQRQLWLYGGTVHGMRSTDVDCQEDSSLAVCSAFAQSGSVSSDRFLFIVRNASSLEAAVGLRWELRTLQDERNHASKFFVSGQYGFLTVEGAGDDVQDLYHYGIGVITTEGDFRGSYLEVGKGGSELFVDNPDDRYKIIGQINWHTGKSWHSFARIIADVDFDDGPDSIQSYFGLRWNLRDLNLAVLFGGNKKGDGGDGDDDTSGGSS